MVFQPVEDVASLVATYSRGADPESADWISINIHHWRRALGWTTLALAALADEYVGWWEAQLKSNTPSNMRLATVVCRDEGAEFGNQVEIAPDIAGTDASDQALPVLAALVKWQCDGGSAPRRGKTFWGGLTEADISGDSIISGSITYLEAAFEDLRTVTVAASAALVIVSRYQGTHLVERPDGTIVKKPTLREVGVSNTIASVTVKDVVATQERRRRGG